jgi:hypothetical protein
MRLNEQRDELERGIRHAWQEIRQLRYRVWKKTSMPYGDGSRSDMVNANSDVLPQLYEIMADLESALIRADRPLPTTNDGTTSGDDNS